MAPLLLPGTTLLSGIPCIVTVLYQPPIEREEQDRGGKQIRFKASVRYVGGVLWDSGQWVGVEVIESSIPVEVLGLDWNDGEVNGGESFSLSFLSLSLSPCLSRNELLISLQILP